MIKELPQESLHRVRTLESINSQLFQYTRERLGNPAPLGLLAFASTTFMLSLFNVGARGVQIPNAIVGMALAYGGTAQFVAGVWEFACGNTFGATAFCSYAAFWWSFAITLIPWFGVQTAFEQTYSNEAPHKLDNAVGIYLACWFIFTFIMLAASFKSSLALVLLFFF